MRFGGREPSRTRARQEPAALRFACSKTPMATAASTRAASSPTSCVFPQGIVWHDGAVYCSSPPSFWKLTDTDGDGVADQREELVTGFANTGVADDMHGGSLPGPDGRLYWCAGRFPHEIRRPGGPVIHKGTAPLILRCRPDGSELEVVCGSQGNAVGVAFTREGDMFASGTFLAPNSMGAGLRDALVHCVDGGEYPVRDRMLNEHQRTGDLLPPLTHLGVCGFERPDDLPRRCAWAKTRAGNLLLRLVQHAQDHAAQASTPSGATFACRNEDFLVSSDTDFHPTDVLEDADGSLLVIDTGRLVPHRLPDLASRQARSAGRDLSRPTQGRQARRTIRAASQIDWHGPFGRSLVRLTERRAVRGR